MSRLQIVPGGGPPMPQAIAELIHPSAVIGPEVSLAEDVRVGPYAIIEGPGCVVEGHACLAGPLSMGADNFVAHGAAVARVSGRADRPQNRLG